MEVLIIKNTLGAAGAPILDVIRATRCPGEGGVVFLCREEGNSCPSTSDRHNPFYFFLIHFFFSGQASIYVPVPISSTEEFFRVSSSCCVQCAFNGGTPSGSGRLGVIGAHHWWRTKTSRSSLNTREIAVTDDPRTSPQDCWHIRFSPSIPRTPIMDMGLAPRAMPASKTEAEKICEAEKYHSNTTTARWCSTIKCIEHSSY